MIRRIVFAAVFVAVALSTTGCCGVFRNFVYRIRNCNGCYPAYGGYAGGCCGDGGVVSPSYSTPIVDAGHGPVMGPPASGCSSCSSNPAMPYPTAGAGVPVVPGYGVAPGSTPVGAYPMGGGYPMAGYPTAGGQVAGIK
ncbi:hypothetical protein [Limnoglobus roseus]|uniref:Uncharacterized protein n=1 Tax=Limnoglobus roseus TaxID=2598579 RepID=A0A5C1AFK7_9BACT|nr:hypothetical protein [Limnoglobus roseus]QEL18041.1 hypothetical protein PX52LOC_05055 [Limnoglobus roseus]